MLVGLVVFAAVYALLAIPRLGRLLRQGAAARWGRLGERALSRPGIAIAGALLVVALLQVTPRAALAAIDWRTLALLLGMMLLVAALDVANVFAVLASALARVLPTPRRLLVGTMLVVAALSALVLNDAVVLLFTPVLVRAARAMGVTPIPFLVGEALAANLGSSATPTGNPQNALIASHQGLSFLAFAAPLLPLALLGLAIGTGACLLAFRKDLRGAAAPASAPEARITNRPMFGIALVAVALALVGFLAGPLLRAPLWAVALGCGALALASAPVARVSPARLARKVDLGILVFFVGLFVLLEVVKGSGLLSRLASGLAGAGSAGFVVVTALLSNVVSNVPAVLLLLPTITSDHQALLLAAASTFAGNLTFLGSAATVIVAETARHEGSDFSVLRFTLVGAPVAILTLALAWIMLG
ncbi:MAG TPA: SLC13 family permease [Candidatus Thermoplasmatota archaeon]|nr:SLC13 family permease [Candidatus Thermoplasmatota archaeon]